jgi:hypothetical protein
MVRWILPKDLRRPEIVRRDLDPFLHKQKRQYRASGTASPDISYCAATTAYFTSVIFFDAWKSLALMRYRYTPDGATLPLSSRPSHTMVR